LSSNWTDAAKFRLSVILDLQEDVDLCDESALGKEINGKIPLARRPKQPYNCSLAQRALNLKVRLLQGPLNV